MTMLLQSGLIMKKRVAVTKVLVTGGAGYVGSVLAPMLLKQGYSVRVLDNLLCQRSNLLTDFVYGGLEFIKGDIRDAQVVRRALEGGEYIVHLAAIVGEPACRKNVTLCRDVNTGGSRLINKLRRPEQKLIFVSTTSIYGDADGALCAEDAPLKTDTDYAVSKFEAEKDIQIKGNYVIFRFATAFGISPRLRLDLLPNDLTYQAVHMKRIMIHEPQFKRTFIHVRDMARSFVFAIENFYRLKDGTYNVGSEEMNLSKVEVALRIKNKIPYELQFVDTQDIDRRNFEVSYAKLRDKGFESRIGLEEGIEEVARGCRDIRNQRPFLNEEFVS